MWPIMGSSRISVPMRPCAHAETLVMRTCLMMRQGPPKRRQPQNGQSYVNEWVRLACDRLFITRNSDI